MTLRSHVPSSPPPPPPPSSSPPPPRRRQYVLHHPSPASSSHTPSPARPCPQKRRNEAGSKGLGCTPSSEERLRGKRRSKAAADKALRESYYEVLQRKNGSLPLSERIKTLRRMVLAQGEYMPYTAVLAAVPGIRYDIPVCSVLLSRYVPYLSWLRGKENGASRARGCGSLPAEQSSRFVCFQFAAAVVRRTGTCVCIIQKHQLKQPVH